MTFFHVSNHFAFFCTLMCKRSFKRSRFTRHFQYDSSGHRLDSVDIGVVLDSKLNFTSHIDSLVLKASRMLGCIRRIGKLVESSGIRIL
jgi:hypothetical protein